MKVLDLVKIVDNSDNHDKMGQIVKIVTTITTLPNVEMSGTVDSERLEVFVLLICEGRVIKFSDTDKLEAIPAKPATRTSRK